VTVIYNDGSEGTEAVTWDQEALSQAISSGVGTYVINGVIEGGGTVKANLQINPKNFVINPSFEDADRSMWEILYKDETSPHTAYQQKAADAKSGEYAVHFYSDKTVDFRVEQTITGLEPGYYNLSMFLQGGDATESNMYLYAYTSSEEWEEETALNGWVNWSNPKIEDILVVDGTLSIGANIEANPGAWGTLDDFYLYKVRDYDKIIEEDPVVDPLPEDDNSSPTQPEQDGGTEQNKGKNKSDPKVDKEQSVPPVNHSGKETNKGKQLPETATNTFNKLLIGGIFVGVGGLAIILGTRNGLIK